MDSASGSLQSSSGGDEEYNSRASVPPPPPFMSLPNQSQFDPFQNYLQSPLLNPNWSLPRSDLNPNTHAHANLFSNFVENGNSLNLSRSQQQGHQNQNSQTAAGGGQRNPKKRTRASRRAPTTVMTTDTSNFRALVQEFTGIPAPPFNNNLMSSHFSKTSRLDLFGTRSSPTSFDLLHRPFPQKLPLNQTFLGYQGSNTTTSSGANNDHHQSLLNSVSGTSTNSNNTAGGNFSSANLFNIQNPLINSLLHNSPTTFPLSNTSNFLVNSSKPDHQHHQGSLSFGNVESNDPFGHGSENVSMTGLPNLISTDQIGRKDGNSEYCDHRNSSGGNYGFSTTMGEEKKGEEEAKKS